MKKAHKKSQATLKSTPVNREGFNPSPAFLKALQEVANMGKKKPT